MIKKTHQPYLTIVTVILVVLLSFGCISLFTEHMFHTWVSYFALTMIPAQMYLSIVLKCEHPAYIAKLKQPWKGLGLSILIIIAGTIVAPFGLYFINGGFSEPSPILIHCSILSVAIFLWFAEIFHGWPFTSNIQNPILAGVLILAVNYILTYFIFNLFFNFTAMESAPFYNPTIEPNGVFPTSIALAFAVTSAAFIY